MAAAVLALAPCTGCAKAIFSIASYRSHEAYSDASFAAFQGLEPGAAGKAEVLAALGPPIHVVGQDRGEIFVYRRLARDTSVINLNPSTVSFLGPAPPIPLFYGSDTSGRDDTLMVFFDAAGRLRGHGTSYGIGRTEGSRAARVGQGVQELLE